MKNRNTHGVKETVKRLFAALLCVIMLAAYLPVDGYEGVFAEEYFETDDWVYMVNGDHAEITSYKGSDIDIEIPAELDGIPVTVLKRDMLNGNKTVLKVTVPETVTVIERWALYNKKLEALCLNTNLDPDSLEDGYSHDITISRIALGPNVQTLLMYHDQDRHEVSWYDGEGMKEYEVDSANPYYTVLDGVLYSKDMTALIRYPQNRENDEFTIPASVTEIGPGAFSDAKHLTRIYCSQDIVSFGEWAFGDDTAAYTIFAPEGSKAEEYAYNQGFSVDTVPEAPDKKDSAQQTITSQPSSNWNGTDSKEVAPVNGVYTIKTAAELNWLSNEVSAGNAFKGKTVRLAADINLRDKEWNPIGDYDNCFCGNFDGQGHKISNLHLTGTLGYNGLFGYVWAPRGTSVTIQNVKIQNVTVDTVNNTTGALAAQCEASRGATVTVKDVTVKSGTIQGGTVGGAVGKILVGTAGSKAVISKVKVTSTPSALDVKVKGNLGGGIVGEINLGAYQYQNTVHEGDVTVEDCRFRGKIGVTGSRWGTSGGIVGGITNAGSGAKILIRHSRVDGQVAGSYANGGGIISGIPGQAEVRSCVNYATVYGANAGGITGSNDGLINECYNGGWAFSNVTGQENGGIAAHNDGVIYNSYNGGSAPTSSSLAYCADIAAMGSGTVENTYSVGFTDKEIETGVAVSHPGVFGCMKGQTVIHSFYDNAFGDAFFGADLKEANRLTDPAYNVEDSGGMTTAQMKSSDSYTNWDFDQIWEFDLDYSRGYPTLTSVKDLLDKDPDTETKNKLKKTQFTFTVVDQSAEPVEDATITVAKGKSTEAVITTGKKGRAKTKWQEGHPGVTVEKEGYVTYEDDGFGMNTNMEITIMIIDKSKVDEFPLRSAIMDQDVTVNKTDTSHLRYELLTQSKTINRQWSNNDYSVIPGTTFAPFKITAAPADPALNYDKAELIQLSDDGDKVIAQASDPNHPVFDNLEYDAFENTMSGDVFKKANDIKIRMTRTDANGKEIVGTQKINLTVEDNKSVDFEVELGDELSFTIPFSSPIFPGMKVSIPTVDVPVTTKVTQDEFQIGLNLNPAGFTFGKDGGFDHLGKTAKEKREDLYDSTLIGHFKKLKKYYKNKSERKVGMGPVHIGLNIIGYASVDLPLSDKLKLYGCVEISASISGETQYLFLVFAVDGKGEVHGEGTIELDFSKAELIDVYSGSLSAGGSIGVNFFAGAGIAGVASVGFYGGPKLGVDWILLGGDHQGLDELYLDGQVSLAGRWMGSNAFEFPIWSDRFNIYSWSELNDPASQGTRKLASVKLTEALTDFSDSEVKEPDEAAAGEWTGGSDILQSSAYSGTAPAIVTVGGDRVMVFASNTDTGREALDRSMLMYSVYDEENSSWGEPQAVSDDGTADYNVVASGPYIAWNNAKEPLAGTGTYRELGKKTEICTAEYDSSSHSFKNIRTVTDNNVFENRLAISGDEDPVISWTTDAQDNIFGVGGDNTFYTASLSSGQWQITKGVSVDRIVIAKAAGIMGGKECLFYVVDEDGDLLTEDDGHLYVTAEGGAPRQVTEEAVTQTAFAGQTHKLLFLNSEGDIYSLSDDDAEPVRETNDFRAAGFAIVQTIDDAQGNVTLVMTRADGAKRNAYFMRYDAAKTAWTMPLQLTGQSDYVEAVAAYYDGDQLSYAYNQRKVTLATEETPYSESNSLHFAKTGAAKAAFELTSVSYMTDDVAAGEDLPMSFTVSNTGTKSVDQVGVKITTGSGNSLATHVQTVVDQAVTAGGSTDFEVSLPVPSDAVKQDYKITVYDPDDESVKAETTIPVGEANFRLDKQVYCIGGHDLVTATVTNTGFEAGDGEIEFYDEEDPDTVFDSYAFKNLAPDEIVHYTFRPEEKGLSYSSLRVGMRVTDNQGRVLSNSRQAQFWNNNEVPVTGVCLDKNKADLEKAGDTLQLNAAVKPAAAAEYAKVIWESSNPDAIEVDENGLVTAKKPGRAVITVWSEDEKYYDECVVNVGTEDIGECTVKGVRERYNVGDSAYGFDPVKPPVKVYSGKVLLFEGQDYTVELRNNDKIGTGHVIITGIGHYTGQIDKTFKIKSGYTFNKPDVTGITIDKHEIKMVAGGEDDDDDWIKVTVTPEDAGDKEVIWTSSDESVAKVSGDEYDAYVTAVGPGTCVITARTRDGDFTDTCSVTVEERVPVEAIQVFPSGTVTMAKDAEETFMVNILPENAYDQSIRVESSDESLLEAGYYSDRKGKGYLEAQGKTGTVTVTVYADDDKIKKSFTVKIVNSVSGAQFSEWVQEVYAGEDGIYFTLRDDNCRNVKFTSSDESILTLTDDGYGYAYGEALKTGVVTITATGTLNGEPFTTRCMVKVVAPDKPIRYIYLRVEDYGDETVYVGKTLQLEASLSPSVPRNPKLIWTSETPETATVDENGLVTGVKTGTAVIRATAEDGGATDTIEIEVKDYIPLANAELLEDEVTMDVGTSHELAVRFTPENATETDIEWETSNYSVVYVFNGIMYAQGIGKATVTGTASNGQTLTCNVTVNGSGGEEFVELEDITLAETDISMLAGDSKTPEVQFTPENATYRNLRWEGSDSDVVSIWGDMLYAEGPGTALVTGTASNGLQVTCNVTVISYGSVEDAEITVFPTSYTYKPNTVRMPQVTLVLDGKTLVEDQDYYVYYWNNEEAGQAEITIRGTGGYTGYAERYFTINKAKQPMRITARKPAVKASALARKAQKIKKTKAFRITKAKGKVTFKKRSGSSKRLTISKAGVITVKKGTKKGTYKIRVRATARGNSNYRKGYKNVTVKVRVK